MAANKALDRDLRSTKRGRSLFEEKLVQEQNQASAVEDHLEDLMALPLGQELYSRKERQQSRSGSEDERSPSLFQHTPNSQGYWNRQGQVNGSENLGRAIPGPLAYSQQSTNAFGDLGPQEMRRSTSSASSRSYSFSVESVLTPHTNEQRRPSTSRIPIRSPSASKTQRIESNGSNKELSETDHSNNLLVPQSEMAQNPLRPPGKRKMNGVSLANPAFFPTPGFQTPMNGSEAIQSAKRITNEPTNSRKITTSTTNSQPARNPTNPRSSPTQTRQRSVTGNIGARKPPGSRSASASAASAASARNGNQKSRQRALSASSLSSASAIPPWQNDAPILYQSDIIAKSDSLFDLSARSQLPPSSSFHTFDDQIIPTVARQIHKKMMEEEMAKKGDDNELISDYARDGSPIRRLNAKRRTSGPLPEVLEGNADNGNADTELPDPIACGPQFSIQGVEPVRKPKPSLDFNAVAPTDRQELWDQPELASPGIAMRTLSKTQQQPHSPQEESHKEKTPGCCSGCIIQ